MTSFIVSAKRTAVVPIHGALKARQPFDLAAPVVRACLADCGVAAAEVDEIIVGNALGTGGNVARSVALASGLSERVAGLTIDRQCCSGLDAVLLADALISAGQAAIVVAGGTESYSRRPLRAQTFADGSPPQPYDQAPFTPWPENDPDMHHAADALAQELKLSRKTQDLWAVESHAKALAARHRLFAEIVPVDGIGQDSFTRALSEKLCARAAPLVGSITPANTSVAADGAAFCVVVSAKIAERLDRRATEILGGCTIGGRPDRPGLAPVAAIARALTTQGLRPDDVVVAEIMEAYAAQAIACVRGAGLEPGRVNVGGGSLARGHPIGASGAINAVRLYHEMGRCPGVGLAAIAAAGGLGTALLLRG